MIAILHNIRSVYNTGSMFRTADGAGVSKIYLTGYTPAPVDKFHRKIAQFAKVSLGAEDFISWEKVKDIKKVIKNMKSDGYKIFAVEQSPRSVPYDSLLASRYKLIAIIMGNEVKGLSPAILRQCDKILEIPMRGRKESLNVSVAFGIVAYFLNQSLNIKNQNDRYKVQK